MLIYSGEKLQNEKLKPFCYILNKDGGINCSGVLIKKDIVLIPAHSIKNNTNPIQVNFFNFHREVEKTFIIPECDLCLLKIKNAIVDFRPMPILIYTPPPAEPLKLATWSLIKEKETKNISKGILNCDVDIVKSSISEIVSNWINISESEISLTKGHSGSILYQDDSKRYGLIGIYIKWPGLFILKDNLEYWIKKMK